MTDCLLGIDIGTTNVKAALYTSRLAYIAEGHAEYPTLFPKAGWAEQDAGQWWSAVCAALRDLFRFGGADSASVRGICISSHGPAVLPVDEGGRPLRNAFIWMDRRSEPQCDEIRRLVGPERVEAITGNRVDPYFAAAKLLWFKEHEGELFARTRRVLQVNGYVNFRLTGTYSTDRVHASLVGLYDVKRRRWSAELCAALGLPPELLPPVYPSGQVIGTVTDAAAAATGLRAGTPVTAGNVDASSAALEAGVIGGGEAVETTGTSTVLMIGCDDFPRGSSLVAMTHAIEGKMLLIGPSSSTGASLRWFRDQLGAEERMAAREAGTDPYKIMDSEAETAGSESGNLVFLPYMAGERAPIWDSSARGAFFGLGLGTSRGMIVRAILEGAAFALRHNIEEAERAGLPVYALRAMGGGAESPLWLRIKASVLGIPIMTLKNASSGVFGNAVLAALGVDLLSGYEEVLRERLVYGPTVEPELALLRHYDDLYRVYRNLYEHTKDDFKALCAVRKDDAEEEG